MIPAVVTAGGRWRDGSPKALLDVGGVSLLGRVQRALDDAPGVSRIHVVGPTEPLRSHVDDRHALIEEGTTGIENLRRGLDALTEGEGLALFAATDLPFLTADAVHSLLGRAPADADIVFPIFTQPEFESRFPDCRGLYAPLEGARWTGGSVFLLRPAAITRNAALLERVFAARKSQWAMARLLGLSFAARFALGRLGVAAAEARATQLTGCRCRVVRGCDPALAFDVDDDADLESARRSLSREPAHA